MNARAALKSEGVLLAKEPFSVPAESAAVAPSEAPRDTARARLFGL
jgi:hypothetical protein